MILYSEGATKAQEDEAEQILGALCVAYPGHPWSVRVYEGGFFIRHLEFPSNWGMNCLYKDFAHDAAVLKREVIMKAGEWLERANLKRGRYDADEPIEHVEGVPDRWQPGYRHPGIELNAVVATGTEPLRETPRPQVFKDDD